jgi:hypothetical protein
MNERLKYLDDGRVELDAAVVVSSGQEESRERQIL